MTEHEMAYGTRVLWSRSSNSTLEGGKAVYEAKWDRQVTLNDEEAGEMPFALTSEGGEDARIT